MATLVQLRPLEFCAAAHARILIQSNLLAFYSFTYLLLKDLCQTSRLGMVKLFRLVHIGKRGLSRFFF